MQPDPTTLGFETELQHFAEDNQPFGAVTPPIFQSSLFSFPTYESFYSGMHTEPAGPPFLYSRISNPTLDIVERKLARLEKTDRAKVFATGMGAISAAIMSCVEPGAHVVAVDTCYGPTRMFLMEYLDNWGVTTTLADGRNTENFLDALTPHTRLVYLESPTSVLFRIQDFEAITRVCREKGILTIADNSYSTPVFQNPANFGVDMIVHSATKYLAGHSDITAGVVCLSADRFDNFLKREVALFGGALGPFQAWLLLRGMRTLSVRMNHQRQTGNTVAEWLLERPEVENVNHTGLPNHPQCALIQKQMRGSSSLLSFRPIFQDQATVQRFVESLKIFKIGVSWGGFESLAVMIPPDSFPTPDVGWIVRLYCGLEDVEDLIADLDQAFAACN